MKIKRRQKRDLYIRVRAKFELSGQTFKLKYNFDHCTEVRFASLLSGGFITAIVVNLPERKPAKRTSVHWSDIDFFN